MHGLTYGAMPRVEGQTGRKGAQVLGAYVDALSWSDAVGHLVDWGSKRESRYVCVVNVHSVVTASQDAAHMRVVNTADLVTPDGAPIAWSLRFSGFRGQARINGPDLMLRYLAEAESRGQKVFFYGSTDDTLARLRHALLSRFPSLQIAGMLSPPFRALTPEEDQAHVDQINASGAAVVFVGLGCPKQEQWMAAHKGRIQAVMVGVGAAFDYSAGTVRRAPRWMQQAGLEWFYRLLCEPRRLARRYLVTNSLFVLKSVRSWL